MLLTIDIGNTNVTLGVFDGEVLRATWRMATDSRKMPDEYGTMFSLMMPLKGVSPKEITDIAMCSVVPPLTRTFEEVCKTYFHATPLLVGAGVRTGVRILYENPRDVGADRVVAAAAAFKIYGGPAIVVDIGTATVFDAVSREGDYLGGAIAPGIQLAAEALYVNTAQLRRVELVRPKHPIGRNTVASIQSGLVYGYVGLVEGLVKRFKDELGQDARVIATGGLASVIAPETGVFHVVNPDLMLIGLKLVYELNRSNPEEVPR